MILPRSEFFCDGSNDVAKGLVSGLDGGPVLEFGGFRLDPRRRLLSRIGGAPVSLTDKAFDALVYLVEHAGRLVTKDELLRALWPTTVVEENSLYVTISTLRRNLKDESGGERLIATVAGAVASSWLKSAPSRLRPAPASGGACTRHRGATRRADKGGELAPVGRNRSSPGARHRGGSSFPAQRTRARCVGARPNAGRAAVQASDGQ